MRSDNGHGAHIALWIAGLAILSMLWEWQKGVTGDTGDALAWAIYFAAFLWPVAAAVLVFGKYGNEDFLKWILTGAFLIGALAAIFLINDVLQPRGKWYGALMYPLEIAAFILSIGYSYGKACQIVNSRK